MLTACRELMELELRWAASSISSIDHRYHRTTGKKSGYRPENDGYEVALWDIRPRLDMSIASYVGDTDSRDNA